MSQLGVSASAGGMASAPHIGKNLYWDDVRIGLQVLMYGVMVLVVGAVASPLLPGWLAALLVLAGGVGTVLGLKICASIPSESGVSVPAQGAFFLGALCLVLAIFNWFTSWTNTATAAACVLLGAAAHVAFALVLKGCVTFLRHQGLLPLTLLYLLLAAAYSLFLMAFVLTPMNANPTVVAAVQVATLVVAAFLLFLLCGAATALQRAQQGLPAEGPAVAAPGAAADSSALMTAERKSAYKPEPPPEEFQFSKNEVEAFEAQDSTAAKAIVALMTGVFAIGVILYTIVAVMSGF